MKSETMIIRKSEIMSKAEDNSDAGKEEAYLHRIHELLSDGWLIFQIWPDHNYGATIKFGRPMREPELETTSLATEASTVRP